MTIQITQISCISEMTQYTNTITVDVLLFRTITLLIKEKVIRSYKSNY